MKKLLLIFYILICSLIAFGQSGSLSQSVYRSRVLDSTSVTTPSGWGLLYFNTQRSPAAWVFSNDNGATWRELGSGSGGGGAGTVTSVSGTTNRVTVASGTTTPVIDISATFEGLLAKVAQRIDQNNAATTSAQLATTLSDESGTGTVVYSSELTNLRYEKIAVTDQVTNIGAGVGKWSIAIPTARTLTGVTAYLITPQASGSIFTVDINENGTTILSTKLTIDNTESNSSTAATPPVISDSSLAAHSILSFDVDQIGNGSAIGLIIVLIFSN